MPTNIATTTITPTDPAWPDHALAEITELHVRGAIAHLERLSTAVLVTGSRAATPYGENVASELAAAITRRHRVIVNAGGFGVDAAALRGSIANGGRPIVIQPSGLNQPHPTAQRDLLDAVVQAGGVVVSTYPADALVSRTRAAAARALAVAISSATLVVEAGQHSSSMATAYAALSHAKPLAAVPGPITSAASGGTNALIKLRGEVDAITSAADLALWLALKA